MKTPNPLLLALSNINEIKSFSDCVSKGLSASLILSGPIVRSYLIGAMALNKKLVIVSDDAFTLYHESLGIRSLRAQYLPTKIDEDLIPNMFNRPSSKHIQALSSSLINDRPGVVFTEGAMESHVPSKLLDKNSSSLKVMVKERIDFDSVLERLIEYGYEENLYAKNIGEYARRGGIIDVFPSNTINPARIEFSGNEVSSIRYYNPTSQLSVKNTDNLNIPTIIKDVNELLTITYKEMFINLGYLIFSECYNNNSCVVKYQGGNANIKPSRLLIEGAYLKTAKNVRKYSEKYPNLFVVGDDDINRKDFPGSTIYVDGYLNGNILIPASGIAAMGVSNANEKNIYEPKRINDEVYSFAWGDFITHVDYGIGIYRGIIQKRKMDYLKLEYANKAEIHLSAHRIDKILPLLGPEKPKLNNISSKAWSKRKQKTKKNIKDIIDDMVAINKNRYSRREKTYKTEDYLEKSLAESFPYVETKDQKSAIEDIYKEMTSPGLMDRLIIGDVGFGKTEVALRAAAKAAFSGVFVMVIVPTTILADQHFILFKNRLENFGVTVEMLSRFITSKKRKEIINNITKGRVDILVGTHALLGDAVPKNELGLLIIDDEHRFGVSHKNELLKLKNSVDVLTLTATPIPRTLQQSLLGIKSVSLINTPPVKRVPIRTQVVYHNWDFIKKIMEVEINRGGQIYFLHNRVESIPFYEKKIVELLPGIKIASAHGGMNSQELEKIILSFFGGNIQVLISTTIIEAGLDVPNANTIIINPSHSYGLSQLYQIRGRVGRGDRQGFCYLVIPKKGVLSDSAVERLKTIQDNTDLGSGYNIAIKDLELRGAGNIFGYEQSGHISSIGYHLYCKMFNEELNKIRGLENNDSVPKIQYFGSASFNDSYVPLSQDRLYYYQRLSIAKDKQDISDVQKEVTDRYGKPDLDTINLYKITEIRTAYTNTLVKNIHIEKDRASLTLADDNLKTTKESPIEKLIEALKNTNIKHIFKQENRGSFGLDIFCRAGDESLTMLIQRSELFYYDNNNT